MTLDTDDISVTRFCALEYRAQDLGLSSAPERIVILFLGHSNGALRVLCHRGWRAWVRQEDVEYITDLMDDFRERAQRTPDELFRQVSSLSVGPLVTYATGTHSDPQERMNVLEVCANMVDLE